MGIPLNQNDFFEEVPLRYELATVVLSPALYRMLKASFPKEFPPVKSEIPAGYNELYEQGDMITRRERECDHRQRLTPAPCSLNGQVSINRSWSRQMPTYYTYDHVLSTYHCEPTGEGPVPVVVLSCPTQWLIT